jgi:hypothetical protein
MAKSKTSLRTRIAAAIAIVIIVLEGVLYILDNMKDSV